MRAHSYGEPLVCRAKAGQSKLENFETEDKYKLPGHDFPPETLDKIFDVFKEKERTDWPKFMSLSREWPQLSAMVFERTQNRAAACEDPDTAMEMLTMLKSLRKVNEEVETQRALLKAFQRIDPEEIDALVTTRRKEIGPAFFEYVSMRVDFLHADEKNRDVLITLATKIASICDALDKAAEDMESAEEAGQTLQKLLSVGSLEEADKMIDDLAASGGLNPALLLTAAKAYNSVKESQYVEEEVKDVMAHLYFKMKETSGRQQPVEVRILKYILSMEDPLERKEQLSAAFTPGAPLETQHEDYLCTTPERLLMTIQTVLSAFDSQKSNRVGMTGEAATLMSPAVIERMREVELDIEKDYM